MKFGKDYLLIHKADKAYTPAFKSCLLRVPYTFNSKCIDEGNDPEVKIIQEIDISKSLQKINNILVEFMTFLSDKKLKEKVKKERQMKLKNKFSYNIIGESDSIQYVENLLTISIKDFHKNVISLIIVPYFVNVLHLSDEQSNNKTRDWILKCNGIK